MEERMATLIGMTVEDEIIFHRRVPLEIEVAYAKADRRDARAMMAIEVDRAWRYRDDPAEYKRNPGTPADRVELWGDCGLRLEIEAMAGEKLL